MKRNLKGLIAIVIIAILSVSLVACGGGKDGTYKYDDFEVSGTIWDALDETAKAATKDLMQTTLGALEFKIEGTTLTVKTGEAESESVKIKFDGDKLIPEEGAEAMEDYGAIIVSRGRMTIESEISGMKIKIILKKV